MDTPDKIVVYRPDDLPAQLTRMLPEGAAPRRCLFFLAAPDSLWIERLFAELPEPEIDHVDEGLALADVVEAVGRRSAWLPEQLHPDAVARFELVLGGEYDTGFHAGDPDLVHRHLQAMGVEVVPLGTMFEDVALAVVSDLHGVPVDGLLLERWIRDEGVGLDWLEAAAPGVYPLNVPSTPFSEVALFDDRAGVEFAPPRGRQVVELRLQPIDPPPSERPPRPPRADLEAAVAVVDEVFAIPVIHGTPEGDARLSFRIELAPAGEARGTLELERDGALAAHKEQPVTLLPPAWPFDIVRYRELLRGVRAAVAAVDPDTLLPSDLLPIELLEVPDLVTAHDFCGAAFDPEPIARLRAPDAVARVLARHGLDLPDPQTTVLLWYTLPDTVHERALLDRAKEAIAELAKQREGEALLEVIAEEWTERALVDGPAALPWQPIHSAVAHALASNLPVSRCVAAGRRAVRRHRERRAGSRPPIP